MTKSLIIQENIKNKIYTVRAQQVMLDKDLAELYTVTTKRLNEQVKRNIAKFPFESLRSQFATSKRE